MHKDVQPGACVACQERPVHVKKRQLCKRCYQKQRLAAWNGDDAEMQSEHPWPELWPRPTAAQEQVRAARALKRLAREARAERNQKIIELAKQGLTIHRIAAQIGISYFAAHDVLKKAGVRASDYRAKKPPPPPKPPELTPAEKLKQRIEQSLALLLTNLESTEEGECWNWTGDITNKDSRYPHYISPHMPGYDPMDAPRAGWVGAYRVAYMLFVGPIPPGMRVRRTCYNRLCCNPEHLQLVSASDLSRRNWGNQRLENARLKRAERTHCHQGHPMVPENVFETSRGYRVCKTCKKAYTRRYKEKIRARNKGCA